MGSALTRQAISFPLHHHSLPLRLGHCYFFSCQKKKNKVSFAQVGALWSGQRMGVIWVREPIWSQNSISLLLSLSSFPLLIVSDTGLTKFLIRGLPCPDCGLLLCLVSVGEELSLLVMSHIMSVNCHSKSLYFSLYHPFTRDVFFGQSNTDYHRSTCGNEYSSQIIIRLIIQKSPKG